MRKWDLGIRVWDLGSGDSGLGEGRFSGSQTSALSVS